MYLEKGTQVGEFRKLWENCDEKARGVNAAQKFIHSRAHAQVQGFYGVLQIREEE